jgi:hypothetical protein
MHVHALEAKCDNGEVIYNEISYTKSVPDLIRYESGRYLPGIRLYLDHGAKSYPEDNCNFPIEFSISENQYSMLVGGEGSREFNFDVTDPTGTHKVFDYMIE